MILTNHEIQLVKANAENIVLFVDDKLVFRLGDKV